MAKKEQSYRESMEEIEAILVQIEAGEIGIDELPGEIERAAKLLQTCREKLLRTEREVEKIINPTED